ncbi:MAG TPA: transposase [Candidatus Binatus sp.]|nr:transposase [Candidatus Binatus sp.]
MLAVHVRTVLGFYRRRARRRGVPDGRGGAVTVIQRFGGGLRLNVHFHSLFLDGVFAEAADGTLAFHPAHPPSDEDVARLLATIRRRVLRLLTRRGLALDEAPDVSARAGEPTGVATPEASLEENRPRRREKARDWAWADLMRRVFDLDVLQCPRCGGRMFVIATIEAADVLRKILCHLGLPNESPVRSAVPFSSLPSRSLSRHPGLTGRLRRRLGGSAHSAAAGAPEGAPTSSSREFSVEKFLDSGFVRPAF